MCVTKSPVEILCNDLNSKQTILIGVAVEQFNVAIKTFESRQINRELSKFMIGAVAPD